MVGGKEFGTPGISGGASQQPLQGLPSPAAGNGMPSVWGWGAGDQPECGSDNPSWSFLLPRCVLLGQVLMEQFYPGALEGAIDFFCKVIILYIHSVIP